MRQTGIASRPAAALHLACAAILLSVANPAAALDFSEAGFGDELFAAGLSSPSAMEFAPDDTLFVAEQGGQLRVIDSNGQLQTQPFVAISVISTNERGLLGVAIAPDYSSTGHVYIYYTSADTGQNTVSRFTRNSANPLTADPASELKILELPSATGYHNGGAIHFGNDGMLYVGVGDAHDSSNAQDLGTVLGKMLRIDPGNYPNIVPPDNPFATAPGARGEIWALGLRNPFTFAVDPSDGRVHINDVGQGSWEEINRGASGLNYGWPDCEGTCSDPRYVDPVHAYDHSNGCAITGGTFYRGNEFPASMQGSYFFADYCGDWIRRLDGSDVMQPFATGVSLVVDLKVGSDHALYYLSRSSGSVRRVVYAIVAPPAPENLRVMVP